ncbi:bifunctional transaldolase/phosoglucose isomerase [Candidatus Magnetoovum chiemensis]|nr:bifunctional transaldolase/phosoglucose isomerase [Candidatus Magnetoovum chiemensis]
MSNNLIELSRQGQSFWYDNISRGLIESGQLREMIEHDGVRGITSNPSIFYKAIKDGNDYDDQLEQIFKIQENISAKEAFYALAIRDIIEASDMLLPVYSSSNGKDGYISIEVDPNLAYDTNATITEALELFNRINRENILIKVPGTKQGLGAFRDLTAMGCNVNVTLLFSVARYEEVISAYFDGLERRIADNKPIDKVFSVSSFFISRIDTAADSLIQKRLESAFNDEERQWISSLFGKTAISNAKMAYQTMVTNFSSERFLNIKEFGGKIQKLLWASTSAKNPNYSDCLYVDELIGPNTINTMPDATVKVFKDHGKVGRTIDLGITEALDILDSIEELNINLNAITDNLEQEGVNQFIASFTALLDIIDEKRKL